MKSSKRSLDKKARENRADTYVFLALIVLILIPVAIFVAARMGFEVFKFYFLVITVGFALFRWMMARARRLKSPSATESLNNDTRPPIVYLRSFGADSVDETRRVFDYFRKSGGKGVSVEEQLAMLMNKAGPFVAIGRPGEKLPQLGASRMYVSDNQWQNTIREMLARCQLVVVRPGETSGLHWEFALIVKTVDPSKVLIVFVNMNDYDCFRKWASGLLLKPLPEKWSSDFMQFAEDWLPIVPSSEWWKRHGIANPEKWRGLGRT